MNEIPQISSRGTDRDNFSVVIFAGTSQTIGNSLSNDLGKVDSNFFCYAATVLSPHRNVLIFTQKMHKPTRRPFTQ